MSLTVCVLQARNDPFRLIRYDIATASSEVSHTQPLLLRRHNAVPGMFLVSVSFLSLAVLL